jgi:hypothetical protein
MTTNGTIAVGLFGVLFVILIVCAVIGGSGSYTIPEDSPEVKAAEQTYCLDHANSDACRTLNTPMPPKTAAQVAEEAATREQNLKNYIPWNTMTKAQTKCAKDFLAANHTYRALDARMHCDLDPRGINIPL